MVSTTMLIAIVSPIVITIIIMLILLIGARSSISDIKNHLKSNINSGESSISDIETDLKRVKTNVNINSEAVDMIIPWVSAAQETFMIPGFGAY
tara:strand:- start:3971 stop:4252 length:282 start_codon:yes stop_codon:yes gene_type:complete